MYAPDFQRDGTPKDVVQKSAELLFIVSIIHVLAAVLLRNLTVDSGTETSINNLLCISTMVYTALDCAAVLTTLVLLCKDSSAENADQISISKLMSVGAVVINTLGASIATLQLLS